MSWTRRDLLRATGALAVVSMVPVVTACSSDPGPDYVYDGPPADRERFTHGVASGDPLSDSVILWTRVDLGEHESLEVYVEAHTTEAMDDRVAAAFVTATSQANGCVKVDLEGLKSDGTWYYRFRCQDQASIIGRTRTAPDKRARTLRLGIASCARVTGGWFHLYRFLAEQELDAIAHLGDYIYEYGSDRSSVRAHEPDHEIYTLDHYRQRYAQYRSDPDLQEAHRMHPWILTWDDHETANNSWSGGAENHDEDQGEGTWAERLAAARQAWFEWMPAREQVPGRIYRHMPWGDLADLIVLDTRIEGREKSTRSAETVNEPGRQLLGVEQEAWLIERLQQSGARWKLLLQQVVMAPWGLDGSPPVNGDAWDGYPAARRRILEQCKTIDGVIVLTGDVHTSWANDVPMSREAYATEGAVAVEAVTPGITSYAPDTGDLLEILLEQNDHIRYAETSMLGCVLLEVGKNRTVAQWWHMTKEAIQTEERTPPTLSRELAVDLGNPRWVDV